MKIFKQFTLQSYDEANLITEAFGIESGYTNTILDLELPNKLPNITYITGESGCGKTTLMKEMLSLYNLQESIPEIKKDTPLFLWGKDKELNLKLLSLVGLGDSTLFISKYHELSDSQQYRAKLYSLLLNDNEYLILDEFLSTLDRKTAKAVAYMFQKAIRKLNKKLIVITAHEDLRDYLQADLIIHGKAFPSEWKVEVLQQDINNPFLNTLIIKQEEKIWYRNARLGELHYKGKYTGGVKDYYGMYLNNDLIGLLIGTYRMHDGGRRISRVVIHPSYRGCGLGVHLIKYYLSKNPTADVIASMALYNPVFEKAGMIRMQDVKVDPNTKLKKVLINNNFDMKKWYSKSYCDEFMKTIENKRCLLTILTQIHYLICPGGKYLEKDELIQRILDDSNTAGRVLWNLRPKTMAKFIGK